ncbi:MAG: hypothetical protein QXU67_02165 [Candidatus Bathyarchaeia archaeon]
MESKILYAFTNLCNGCRACELACSLTLFKEFNPEKSKIRVSRVVYEGLNYPVIECDGGCPAGDPQCVYYCPTGCLVYVTRKQAVDMNYELTIKRQVQPVFKFIAPWKWKYPWRPWPR